MIYHWKNGGNITDGKGIKRNMVSSHLIGVFFAIASAVMWGTSDFSGGIATRRNRPFQVLTLVFLSVVVVLVVFAIARNEPVVRLTGVAWSLAAGISGSLGLAVLYRSLSLHNAAIIAPTAAVIGSALPVVFSFIAVGLPDSSKISGIIFAIIGIWLASQSVEVSRKVSQQGLLLALLAGIGLGGFFILIAQVEQGAVFMPLVIAKSAGLAVALLMLLSRRDSFPSLGSSPIALFAGILDASANIFFLFALQFTRLDIASVLSSMYALATVILASILLKEAISNTQWVGIILCMIAIGLIVL
jgi:drug/metabolite transporter (DMT)-like permease